MDSLFTIKEAGEWATAFTGRKITPANISYLLRYRRLGKRESKISKNDLQKYYQSYHGSREVRYKEQLDSDLNWELSFDRYKEAETTKHVHRLHPYKGKFIPQLVEYFLDSHTDRFKTETYFEKGDILLDPFSGSGTTLVQAGELGMNALGIDVSAFNTLMGHCKVARYDFDDLRTEIIRITNALSDFSKNSNIIAFEENLSQELYSFNKKYFPVNKHHHELEYGKEMEERFLPTFKYLAQKYNIPLRQDRDKTFLDKWYSPHIRNEIDFVFGEIKKIKQPRSQKIAGLILSRTMRSCRATTHTDLATLLEPVITTYYCDKHGKLCKPLFSLFKWWKTYSNDTIDRLLQFDKLRTETYQLCLTGDSRNIDLLEQVHKINPSFGKRIETQKITGIFSSPPYVGLIDYHEQHAYAYDVFGFERNDGLEIGSMSQGQGKIAQQNYVRSIADVLNHCKRYLRNDYHVFLVANDKHNLYPRIAEESNMRIVNRFKRPVLNRTEKFKTAYSETIFHLKEQVAV